MKNYLAKRKGIIDNYILLDFAWTKRKFKYIFIIQLLLLFVLPVSAQTGTYTQNGGTSSQSDQTFTSSTIDQSGVYVLNSGKVILSNCKIITTGNTSSTNNASQYGINAGILAASAGVVTMSGGSVVTSGSGANGLFATGAGSAISMSNGTITASGANAHGVDATYKGSIILTNVNVTTSGASSSAVATDFGGGTVTVTGGTIVAANTSSSSHSAGIYSTGVISVTGASVSSLGDCGGVIDGANSILLTNTSLTSVKENFKVWKTAPASGAAAISVNGGSLISSSGDVFYVTGSTGNAANAKITVTGNVTVKPGSGNIINVDGASIAALTVEGDTLSGNMIAASGCTLSVILQNKTNLKGSIQLGAVSIDATSSWSVTGNSVLTSFSDASGISGTSITNISGNGFNVYYDAALSSNGSLGGKTFTLVNGGVLTPKTANSVNLEKSTITFNLEQNFPNPFNPSTSIAYSLPGSEFVTLKVYDIMGKEICTLINNNQAAGNYKIEFKGNEYASGVYFYVLKAGNYTQLRKMILLR